MGVQGREQPDGRKYFGWDLEGTSEELRGHMTQRAGLVSCMFSIVTTANYCKPNGSNNDSSSGQNSDQAWLGPLFKVSGGRNQGSG